MDLPGHITVCICTFRRAEVMRAIDSVQRQEGIAPEMFSILVIDNDDTDQNRETIERVAQSSPVGLRYIHVPARNISLARNGALDNANSRWIAYIDDDEMAQEDWLVNLWRKSQGAEIVLGPVISVYAPHSPDWLRRCDFHSTRAEANLANAYTGNVLIDLEFVNAHSIRFLPELGRTGGEDTVFFRQLAQLGARSAYASDAVVYEPVLEARANMRWVLRRNLRAGQTHGMVCRLFDRRAFAALWYTAMAKSVVSALAVVLCGPGSIRSRQWLARACFHFGALSYRVWPTILKEYG